MSRLTQREAARQWGRGRATIQRAIRAGEITPDSDGLIDVADLLRVFGPAQVRASGPLEPPPEPAAPDPAQVARLAALEAENVALRALLDAKDANLADLRGQVRMLTHEAPRRRRWWWS